mgnify:CR=1 FL=1
MQIVRANELKPGMRLARTVYGTKGQMLLSAGTILNRTYIRRLIALGFPAVYIGDPTEAYSFTEPISENTRIKAINVLKDSFADANIGGTLKLEPVSKMVYTMIDEITLNKDVAVHLADIRSHSDYTFGHSVNVCVLAIMMGNAIRLNELQLSELAMGAMLHDVGKILIPDSILLKATQLNAVEWKEMKRHSRYGFDILRLKPEFSVQGAHVAYQHHERINGSGYPRGLKGEEIHLYARLVAIADTYDAMTADRVYRKGVTPNQALKTIHGLKDKQFDTLLVDAFLDSVYPYPAGSKIELDTGEVGIVVAKPKPHELHVNVGYHETDGARNSIRKVYINPQEESTAPRIILDM